MENRLSLMMYSVQSDNILLKILPISAMKSVFFHEYFDLFLQKNGGE